MIPTTTPLPLMKRTSLAEDAYETLLEAIVSGSLAAGAELRAVELARQLGISRTPVMEAIRRLEGDGLVEQDLGRIARVAKFTAADIAEVYSMRGLLESHAAYRAATRMSAECLAQLRERIDHLWSTRGAVDWCAQALEYDLNFHEAIALAAENTRLAHDVLRYRLLVRGFCRMTGTSENLEQALIEHTHILEALERRDGLAAQRSMQQHVAARLLGVQESLQQGQAEKTSNTLQAAH